MASPTEPTSISLDTAEVVWELLAERVEAFVNAWESSGAAPNLADFAPPTPPSVRRLALVELVKVDLEYRWQRQASPRQIEDYLAEFPELADEHGVPCDLVYEEYHVRRKSGETVTAADYFHRFPDLADELGRLLGVEAPLATTSMFRAQKVAEVQPGEQLDDFDLLTALGKGAFATVFLARQRSLQRLVALKVSANQGNEPQTLAQLEHPHIVRVYDQRLEPNRGLRLLYMQYVAGGTLQDVIALARSIPASERSGRTLLTAIDRALERRGESPPEDTASRARLRGASWSEVVCWLGGQLASALHYAHRRGVLHRDLKPANILLSAEASARLVDFNISYCSKVEGASPAAYFGGSLAYMSPEQLEACNVQHPRKPESLDGRSDIYSLGVVLFELLTGKRPFPDEPLVGGWCATLQRMVEQRETLPDAPDCPPALVEVLERCLQPAVERRFTHAGEVGDQLRLCLHPAAQRLLRGAGEGWRRLVQRNVVAVAVVVALLPNAVAAWFNLVYNRQQIVDRLHDSQAVFWRIQFVTNAIAFPLGIALIIVLATPLARGLRNLRAGSTPSADTLAALRRRSLRLGHYIAIVGIIEWVVAGISYPIAMQASGVALAASDYAHFIGSLALCGLIAAAYPFYGVTVLYVRAIYPPLVQPGANPERELANLGWLHRMTWIYLALAASVPMLGVLLMANLFTSPNRLALGVLSAVSLVGFGLIFWLARIVQHDLGTLAFAIQPQSEPDAAETESFRVKLG